MNPPISGGMGPGPSQSPRLYHPSNVSTSPRQYSAQPMSPPPMSFGNAPYPLTGMPPMATQYYPYPGPYPVPGPSHQNMGAMHYPMGPYYQPPLPHYAYAPHHLPLSPRPPFEPSGRNSDYSRPNGSPHRGAPRNFSRNPPPLHFPASASPSPSSKRPSPATLATPSSPFPLQTTAPAPPVHTTPATSIPQSPTSINELESASQATQNLENISNVTEAVELPLTPIAAASPRSQSPSLLTEPRSVTDNNLGDANYTISSSRPEDPSTAHGLIISYKAKPPPNVVKFAFMVEEEEPLSPILPVSSSGINDDSERDSGAQNASVETTVEEADVSPLPEAEALRPETPESSKSEPSVLTPNIKATVLRDPVHAAPVTPTLSSVYSSTAPTPTSHTPSPSSPISTATSISVQPSNAKSFLASPVAASSKPKPLAKSWADTVKNKETSKPSVPAAKTSTPASHGSQSVNQPGTSSEIALKSPSLSVAGLSTDHAKDSRRLSEAVAPSEHTLPPLHVLLTSSPLLSSLAPLTHPRGLVNTGNMCFANVVLQGLLHTSPFYKLVDAIGRAVPAELGRRALIDATVVFLQEFQLAANVPPPDPLPSSGRSTPLTSEQLRQLSWQQDSFIPQFLYDAMSENKRFDSMRGGRQEDAEEFLGFFLDTLHEELLAVLSKLQANPPPASAAWASNNSHTKSVPAGDEREVERPVSPTGDDTADGWMEVGKKNKVTVTRTTKSRESAITRIFGGKLRSVLRIPGVGKESVTLEPYQPLQLDIQPDHVRTIEDAFRHLTEPEIVHISARGGSVDATKQVFIESVPPILVVHIKRFLYDAHGVQKSNKVLMYRTKLEIPNEVLAPAQRSARPPRYRLYGVIYHHGKYATGGHYTIDLLRQDHSEWIRVDDTHIEAIMESDVSVLTPEKGLDKDKVAYLLFYQRVADDRPSTASSAVAATTVNGSPSSSSWPRKAVSSQKSSKGSRM